ncbi:MAG: macro domain-containing protein [Anaerolineae bacterium]|nr:macro domain-containing protein [Anaerolineae bacterium]
MKAKVNKVTIQLVQENILSLAVQAVVTVTDTNLTVNPALAAKAGPSVQEACDVLQWCDVGSAVMTDPGDLPIQKIIHAVGPRWGEGSERGKLANVTIQSLRLAEQSRLKSIAIPAISTGILGYPVENCAKTMLTQILDFTFEARFLKTILICLDSPSAYSIFKAELTLQLDELKEAGEGEVSV